MRVPIKTKVLIGKGFVSLVGRARTRAEASTCRPRLVEGDSYRKIFRFFCALGFHPRLARIY